MAVQINSWNPPNGYPELKGEYIDKYYDLVLLKAPENQCFSMHELFDFPLHSEELNWYNKVSHDVMVALISDDLIKFETGSNIYLRLTAKGKNKRKGIDQNQTTINNYNAPVIKDSEINNSQILQGSVFEKSPISIKTKEAPKSKPEIKSLVQKIFSNPWVLLVCGIAIEEITLGKIYKYIIELL